MRFMILAILIVGCDNGYERPSPRPKAVKKTVWCDSKSLDGCLKCHKPPACR